MDKLLLLITALLLEQGITTNTALKNCTVSDGEESTLILLGELFLLLVTLAGIVFITQPEDHNVCIGSSATVKCMFMGTDVLPSWFINSTLYTSSDLPPNHRYDGRLMTIDNVLPHQNDTTYQCFFNLIISESLCQLKSHIGKLQVQTTSMFTITAYVISAFVNYVFYFAVNL